MLNRHSRATARLAMSAVAVILVAGCGGSGAGTPPSAPLAYGAQTAPETPGAARSLLGSTTKFVTAKYDIRGGRSPVQFQTIPLAICRLNHSTTGPAFTTSDQSGHVAFSASVSNPLDRPHIELACSAKGRSEAISINFESGAVASTQKSIPLPSEMQMRSVSAKLGFDPRTASIETLIEHNLPPRPSNSQKYAMEGWLRAAFTPTTQLYTKGVEVPGMHTEFHPKAPQRHAGVKPATGRIINSETTNWAGWGAAGGQGTYNNVLAYWDSPPMCSCSYNPSYANLWVGLDGSTNQNGKSDGNIFQDGLSMNFVISNGVKLYNYTAWWEEFPNNNQTNLFTMPSNDNMYATVYKNISGGVVYAQYYVKDLDTGQTSNFAITAGSELVGDSSEWIMEAPAVGGTRSALADFSTTTVTSMHTNIGSTTYSYDQIPTETQYNLYHFVMAKNNEDSYTTMGSQSGVAKYFFESCC
jgi:hypothetical protein